MWFLGNSLIVSKLTPYLFVFDSRCWNGAHKRVSNLWIFWYANYDNFLHIHMNKFHRNHCISITSLEKAVISRRPLNVNYKPLRVIPTNFLYCFLLHSDNDLTYFCFLEFLWDILRSYQLVSYAVSSLNSTTPIRCQKVSPPTCRLNHALRSHMLLDNQ